MANSAEDLQHLINGMALFSLQWGLVVNTDKTEITTFNKAGRIISKPVDKFVYLGIPFVPTVYDWEGTSTESRFLNQIHNRDAVVMEAVQF